MRTKSRLWITVFATLCVAAACGDDGGGGSDPVDAGSTIDARPTVDATPDAPGIVIPDHLVISEVMVRDGNKEFIEILNPTSSPVTLTNYYLADDHDYFKLPGVIAGNLTIGRNTDPDPDPDFILSATDFVAQFPAGATVPAKGIIVVAFDYDRFLGTNGFDGAVDPDFAMYTTGKEEIPAGKAMVRRTVQDVDGMDLELMTDSSEITNVGEGIVLFHWDGVSDLVQDVDMVHAGTPPDAAAINANALRAKNGEQVDGPDGDAVPGTYANDALTLGFLVNVPDPGLVSYQRIAFEIGEAQSGGNGVTGNDETSEDLSMTFENDRTANPGNSAQLCPLINGCAGE